MLSESKELLLFIRSCLAQDFFMQWDRLSKPLPTNSQSRSKDTSKQDHWMKQNQHCCSYPLGFALLVPRWATLYLPALVIKKIHMKECLTCKNCQPSCSVCTFVSHLRDSQILCCLWLFRATFPVTWRNPRVIQTVVAVQLDCSLKTGKLSGRRLYILDTKSKIFSGQNTYRTLGTDWSSCQSDTQEVYVVF